MDLRVEKTCVIDIPDDLHDNFDINNIQKNIMLIKLSKSDAGHNKTVRVLGLVSPFGAGRKRGQTGLHVWRPINTQNKKKWAAEADAEECVTVEDAPLCYNPDMDFSMLLNFERNLRGTKDVFLVHLGQLYEGLDITISISCHSKWGKANE